LLVLEDRCLLSTYTVTDLGTLGMTSDDFSFARAINASGQVAGDSSAPNWHGFLYRDGAMTDIGTLSGSNGTAYVGGLNDLGQVVGKSWVLGDPGGHAFLYDSRDGTMMDLGTFGGNEAMARGINNASEVVGSFNSTPHAFLRFSDGTFADLGTLGGTWSAAYGINSAGDVVGVAMTQRNVPHPFLVRAGTSDMIDLETLGGAGYANAVNDVGQVVGLATTPTGTHAFLWDSSSGMTDLGSLGGQASAKAINNAGEVVGGSQDQTLLETRAFIYSGGLMTDLNTLIPPGSGLFLEDATGINDAGQIVGIGLTPDQSEHAFLLTPDAGSSPRSGAGIFRLLASVPETSRVVEVAVPPSASAIRERAVVQTVDSLSTDAVARQATDAVFAAGHQATAASSATWEVEGLELALAAPRSL
jgi:probable HAF family extracellular repeat protein